MSVTNVIKISTQVTRRWNVLIPFIRHISVLTTEMIRFLHPVPILAQTVADGGGIRVHRAEDHSSGGAAELFGSHKWFDFALHRVSRCRGRQLKWVKLLQREMCSGACKGKSEVTPTGFSLDFFFFFKPSLLSDQIKCVALLVLRQQCDKEITFQRFTPITRNRMLKAWEKSLTLNDNFPCDYGQLWN